MSGLSIGGAYAGVKEKFSALFPQLGGPNEHLVERGEGLFLQSRFRIEVGGQFSGGLV